ncbi:MAG: A24 family peptidase [Armatimonadota bacterium]
MLLPRIVLYATVFALGSIVGSFLNVCIYRLPRDRSIISPPSHCPQCGGRLRAVDLVPLFSFLALGRKCRFCGGPIGWRYFTVELLTGVLFVAGWFGAGESLQAVPYWVFIAATIAVVFTDLDHMIIPDGLVIAAFVAGVAAWALAAASGQLALLSVRLPWGGVALPRWLAGGVVGVVVFMGVRAFSQLLFRREGMGLGDVKLAGAIGAMLGPGMAMLSFGLAVATGAVLGLALIALRVRRRMEYLPFGPFLAAASLVALLAPRWLLSSAVGLYERWVGFSLGLAGGG